jgi:hypothetical protein
MYGVVVTRQKKAGTKRVDNEPYIGKDFDFKWVLALS